MTNQVANQELNSYGLNFSEGDADESDVETPDESEEPEELVNASEDDVDSEEEVDEEMDEEEEEEEDDDNLSADARRAEAAEEQMRKFQSLHDSEKARNDNLQNQFQTLINEFQSLKESPEPDADLGDDDDLVDVGKLKKAMSGKGNEEVKKIQTAFQQRTQAQQYWVGSQTDISDIQKFIMDNNLNHDPSLTSIQTDSVGYYHIVKTKMLEKQMADLVKEHNRVLKTSGKRKANLPPTSGNKGSGTRKSKAGMGDMERKLANFGNKIGVNLTAKR